MGLAVFFAVAGFFVAAAFGFFGVAAFFTFGVVAFFGVAVFFAPAGFAAVLFALGFTCFGFFVALAALLDFGVALDRDFFAFTALTFFGLAAAAAVVDVAAALPEVFAAVATFFAGLLLPADLERARFFVPEVPAVELEALFFGLLVFFFVAGASAASLNEPLAPFPLVCLKCLDFTPFFRANLRC